MMSAIATIIDEDDDEGIEKVIETIDDPAGTFYRFSVPGSIIRRKIRHAGKEEETCCGESGNNEQDKKRVVANTVTH